MKLVKHTYSNDCIFLIKDLTGIIDEITVKEKEELIKSGRSYSEFISKEEAPTEEVMQIFLKLVKKYSLEIATYIAKISELTYREKGKDMVIVSLARAGTPYGILMKKYLEFKYNVDIPHYSISIIRGKGIDYNAIKYICTTHQDCKIQFVDGWTGKGSITKELNKSIKIFNKKYNCNIDDSLAVIADPARLCKIYGTRDDIAIPNCCLNATISGLISRTVCNEEYIGSDEFHGAKTLDYLREYDYSQQYINDISKEFKNIDTTTFVLNPIDEGYSDVIVEGIRCQYNVKSINSIKLSIGESSRVLLRRNAKCVLVKNMDNPNVEHILKLADKKRVPIQRYDKSDYECVAIIEE